MKEIKHVLPSFFGYDDPVPEGLIGATVVDFGSLAKEQQVIDGNLVIDIKREGSNKVERLIFGFNSSAMWLHDRSCPQ